MKYLIVGLGNIGEKYDGTRHNIGFEVIDNLVSILEKNNLDNIKANYINPYKIDKFAITSLQNYKGKKLYFIKPTLYMNNSGKSVKYWKDKLDIPLENILIITDDLALEFGKLRLKPKGSSGGHNGLKSIEENLKTIEYPRLKIGLGNNFPKGKQDIFVLSPFNKEEKQDIPFIINNASEIVLSFIFDGLANAMNKFN